MSYDDPRLAVVYDVNNPDGPDHDFFRRFADDIDARQIIDLGCGTGMLTVSLVRAGRTVTGIDPAAAMLERAADRPGGDAAIWVRGTSEQILPGSGDLVIMSGNVAMHILGEAWLVTLAAIARGLGPGGRLVFETRNPDARAWESWNEPLTERETPVGMLRESLWTEPPDEHGVAVMHCHNEFAETGEVLDVAQRLQFRSRELVETDLLDTGLHTVHVWRDWSQSPFAGGPDEPLMIFDAVRS